MPLSSFLLILPPFLPLFPLSLPPPPSPIALSSSFFSPLHLLHFLASYIKSLPLTVYPISNSVPQSSGITMIESWGWLKLILVPALNQSAVAKVYTVTCRNKAARAFVSSYIDGQKQTEYRTREWNSILRKLHSCFLLVILTLDFLCSKFYNTKNSKNIINLTFMSISGKSTRESTNGRMKRKQ